MFSLLSRFVVRNLSVLIGLGFAGVLMLALVTTIVGLVNEPPEETAEEALHLHPRHAGLSSDGIFGKFDQRQLQRGFQVYKEVCSGCHSLRLVAFRDLEQIGYSAAQVKAIADAWQIEQPSVNPETGEPATRKNLASDRFPSPYANEVAARAANNNASPPDLSLMVKSRHDGNNYVYSLLTGYRPQPAEVKREFPGVVTPQGLHWNPYFPNLNIAMPPPLTAAGQVTYQDGTAPTVDQMSKDVSAFLTWTAEPMLERRHVAGGAAVLFLLIFTALAWGAYRNIWRGIKH